MASVSGFTAERLLNIEKTTVVGGNVNEIGNLILATREGAQLDAGSVIGLKGDVGPERPQVAGVISIFGGTVPPPGWMLCDGAAISRTTFSDLFAAIGITYGAGNGTTTFNVPDFRGRVAVGYDATQTEFDNLGEKGGAKTHTLTIAEMPTHNHTIKGYQGVDNKDFSGTNGAFAAADAATVVYDQQTAYAGGGAAHNNLQPYSVAQYIISIGNIAAAVEQAETYVGRGTTADRNLMFGTPATDPARVALANRQIIWFNTELGWEESYYATEGKTGLVVTGLQQPHASGWYPTGQGPMVLLEPSTFSAQTTNSWVKGWGTPVRRRGGTNWFVSTDGRVVEFRQAGRYDIKAWTVQQTGSGTAFYSLRLVENNGTTVVRTVDGNSFPLNASLYTRVHSELDDTIAAVGQKVGLYLDSGTLDLHVSGIAPRGQFIVRYIGPPLVSD
ncbi:minor tail protein [Arthrobacter phage CastorTray]|uniref:Minor tail protein n=1 Tax=Arthrobacter phage CastorTray TaxID=2859632 RepID=A0AAE7WDE0_9CAUD|nr:minor tail protein [Arthrobacter phage CastorTray]QYC55010.1 minor tail protein [Arthrobacter phage CastorTray]